MRDDDGYAHLYRLRHLVRERPAGRPGRHRAPEADVEPADVSYEPPWNRAPGGGPVGPPPWVAGPDGPPPWATPSTGHQDAAPPAASPPDELADSWDDRPAPRSAHVA
jgi:hypothetical protein